MRGKQNIREKNMCVGKKKGKERKNERASHALSDSQCSDGRKSISRELKLVYSTRTTNMCQKQKEIRFSSILIL